MTVTRDAAPGAPRRPHGQTCLIVLAQLARSGRPQTAYGLMDQARSAGERLSAAQIYRALEQLMARGQVDRIECLSAYVTREGPAVAYLLCDVCDLIRTVELPELVGGLLQHAHDHGFKSERIVLEQRSRCADCRSVAADQTWRAAPDHGSRQGAPRRNTYTIS